MKFHPFLPPTPPAKTLVMNANSVPPAAPQDLATERLAAAVESAICVIQERLTDLDNDRDAKWSVSDLVRLLQLRKQLQGERPRTVLAYWVGTSPEAPNPPLTN